MPQFIPTCAEQFQSRWKYVPTWRAWSPTFRHIGERRGYTKGQAELRLLIAIVVDVLIGERVRERRART